MHVICFDHFAKLPCFLCILHKVLDTGRLHFLGAEVIPVNHSNLVKEDFSCFYFHFSLDFLFYFFTRQKLYLASNHCIPFCFSKIVLPGGCFESRLDLLGFLVGC